MNQINQCILEGNLVKNPEYKENIAGTGHSVSKFVLASNKMYKNSKGELVNEVSYFDIEAWGNTAKKTLEAKAAKRTKDEDLGYGI